MIDSSEDLIPIGIFVAVAIRFVLLVSLLGSIQEKQSRAGLDILKTKIEFSEIPTHLLRTFSSFFDETPEAIKYSLYYVAPTFEVALVRMMTGHGKSRGIRQYLFLQSHSNSLPDFSWTQRLGEANAPAVSSIHREAARKLLSESGAQLRSSSRWLILRADLNTSMPGDSRLPAQVRAGRYASFVLAILGVGQELLKMHVEAPFVDALKQLQSNSVTAQTKESKSRSLVIVPIAFVIVVSLLVLNVFIVGALKRLIAYSSQSKTIEWSIGVATVLVIWVAGVAINRRFERG